MSQVFDKLKAKGLLKPLDLRPIPNPLPLKFDVNKRCAYHQIPGHDTNCCFTLHYAIQDLIDNKVVALPTRPSITNNPLPNHNFRKGLRVNCLMTEEENKEDPSDLIYDLLECFMMTLEELKDRTFTTTTTGYDIWNEVPKQENNQTSINGERHFKPQENNQTPTNEGGRHFKPQENSQTSTNEGRHFKPQENNQTSKNRGRHFKPRDTDPHDSTKIAHIIKGGDTSNPHFRD